jgi:hypothetical protein
MATPRLLRPLPLLLLSGLLSPALPGPASAGPLVRRAQERQACQEFAGRLQQASGNPATAQQVYQQGVLQLVQRFGENPCRDIPAPTATGTPGAPASAPATSTPAPGAPVAAPAAATTPAASAQQQQACQQFAGKLQSAAASGGAAAVQQTYAMGLQKLTGMFGANPCPGVTPPR